MPEVQTIWSLAELLRSAHVYPTVSADRVVRSAIYDASYRVAVVACAFDIHAKTTGVGPKRIRTAYLKLLQFAAVRPWLVRTVREWASTERTQLSLLATQRARGGFLGDTMFDRIVDYMTALQLFSQVGRHLTLGPLGSQVDTISNSIRNDNLFAPEREALVAMQDIRITNEMLEGW